MKANHPEVAGLGEVLRRAGEAILSSAFPASCAGCGGAVDASPYAAVCVGCAKSVRLIQSPRCATCGFPFYGETDSKPHCWHCEHLSAEFGRGWSIALFRGVVRELLYALKYEQGFWALRDIRRIVRDGPELASYVDGAVLVPVPLHPRKLRERGYNQSALIVEELLAVFPGLEAQEPLRRTIDTVSQTRFNRHERIRNLRNAFSLKKKHAIEPGKRYLIVDDVFTTGSTLNACAAVLRRAGAGQVDVLTVGHG